MAAPRRQTISTGARPFGPTYGAAAGPSDGVRAFTTSTAAARPTASAGSWIEPQPTPAPLAPFRAARRDPRPQRRRRLVEAGQLRGAFADPALAAAAAVDVAPDLRAPAAVQLEIVEREMRRTFVRWNPDHFDSSCGEGTPSSSRPVR